MGNTNTIPKDIYNVEPKPMPKLETNTHTKILNNINDYLDNCKKNKLDCGCSHVLLHDKNALSEDKKWKFLYQCTDNIKNIQKIEKMTLQCLHDDTPVDQQKKT